MLSKSEREYLSSLISGKSNYKQDYSYVLKHRISRKIERSTKDIVLIGEALGYDISSLQNLVRTLQKTVRPNIDQNRLDNTLNKKILEERVGFEPTCIRSAGGPVNRSGTSP